MVSTSGTDFCMRPKGRMLLQIMYYRTKISCNGRGITHYGNVLSLMQAWATNRSRYSKYYNRILHSSAVPEGGVKAFLLIKLPVRCGTDINVISVISVSLGPNVSGMKKYRILSLDVQSRPQTPASAAFQCLMVRTRKRFCQTQPGRLSRFFATAIPIFLTIHLRFMTRPQSRVQTR